MVKKNIPRTIAWGSIIACCGLFLWAIWANASFASRMNFPHTAENGQLIAVQPKYNLGTVSMAQGIVRREFTVRNTGKSALTLNKLFTTCTCLEATLVHELHTIGPVNSPRNASQNLSEILLPSESATIQVAFDPKAHGPAGIGKIVRKVGVEYGAVKPVTFRISAFVTP